MIIGINHWTYENVDKKGRVINKKKNKHGIVSPGGVVGTKPRLSMSNSAANCGLDNCHCSDGHAVWFKLGRNPKNKIVEGFTVYFSDRDSVVKFSKELKLKVGVV